MQKKQHKLEKRLKILQAENIELRNSLKIFNVETTKLEKKLEVEKKNN